MKSLLACSVFAGAIFSASAAPLEVASYVQPPFNAAWNSDPSEQSFSAQSSADRAGEAQGYGERDSGRLAFGDTWGQRNDDRSDQFRDDRFGRFDGWDDDHRHVAPVPEAASWMMFAFGAGVAVLLARRKSVAA